MALPSLDGPGSNANDLMAWLTERPDEDLEPYAQALFEKILSVASQPRNSTKDACVKLCGFVQLCLKSKHESLRLWAFQERTATELLNYYLEWNEKDQHRSMRLVLDLVSTLILQNPNAKIRESLRADILSELMAFIAKRSSRPVVKSCMSSLIQFLAKSVFSLDDVLRQYQSMFPELVSQPAVSSWRDFVASVFRWMELHYICPVAGKFLVTIFSSLNSESSAAGSRSWSSAGFNVQVLRDWLETALSTNPDILESVKNYVLAPLFKSDHRLSFALLEELQCRSVDKTSDLDTDIAALIQLAALEVGKKSSIVDDPNPEGAQQGDNVILLDRDILEHFLIHTSHDVRSFAMSLLVTSSSTTKPYSPMAFELLRRHLRSFHSDPDAKFRNEILAHTKNMVKRIKGAISVLQRDIGRLAMKTSKVDANGTPVNTHISKGAKQIANAGELWLRESLRAHETFFDWYLDFLRQELVPTASYQRHITSLKSLVNVVRSGKVTRSSADERIYQDPQWLRTILDLVLDPFDDVRETASSLLMLFPPVVIRTKSTYAATQSPITPLDILAEFCTKAASLSSRTSRADHSDGTARSLGLLCAWQDQFDQRLALLSQTLDGLERKIKTAEQDLGYAVMSEPVHGTFAAIRYMWEVFSQSRYSGEELKLLAVPQFRIIDLCRRIWEVVSYVVCDDSPEGHLPEELEEIEGLDTKGLLSYSFRAAHESSNLTRTIVGNLSWYEGTLSSIYTQRSTTRRSAGIPALITGILASNADNPSFQKVMNKLQEISAIPASVSETDGSNLPQVHAFNCLKEVFKSSLLSKNAEVYLPQCLQLATNSLKSEVWAIRNCALLLLRSLIDTLFGTTESKSAMETGWDGKTLRLSYTKYSSLPPILLNLLQSGERAMEPSTLTQSSAAESVFPALEIIRRAGPPESHREELYRYITYYLGSRQWHVREIAARTLCSFLMNEDWVVRISELFEQTRGSANRLHGTLLTVKVLLDRRLLEAKEEAALGKASSFEGPALQCSETAAAYIEALNKLWQATKARNFATEPSNLLNEAHNRRKGNFYKSAALLDNRVGMMALHQSAISRDLGMLRAYLFDVLHDDVDTACALLEAIPDTWGSTHIRELCGLYLETCQHTRAPEARAVALTNLAELMDECLLEGNFQHLPIAEDLDSLQEFLVDSISPTLANAVLLASGSIIAVHTRKHHGQMSFFTFEQRLRSWGKAMADALHDSNTFDMRMAAARALKSFSCALGSAVGSDAAYIPFLLALYTTLVDDDEEIRETGAIATASVMAEGEGPVKKAQPLVAVDAADALLAWMHKSFGQTNELKAYVACRLVGDPLISVDIGVQDLSAWATPEQQFAEALEVDESLFAIEDQNLFIDEVRETERWAVLFRQRELEYDEIQGGEDSGCGSRKVLLMDSSLAAAKEWTQRALRVLAEQVTKEDDGPLGWASNPRAFSLCHRVLLCGKTLSALLGAEGEAMAAMLEQIREAGQSTRLHGLLLSTL
ncbi:hypothetical protein M406DRAFT_246934 [Cryphonectria parasitica EP155]|uniref:DUF2428 domain-containing protein n=1 Tax=Cryphonectria parasitica (strain ATCC 38755 / EP155) TaxID=660469 RepID=A0A9P4YBD6_CRYP1|nr:uncharacterized protein M406DRAFT_246934 [Cryphonectria parasitica EP155]KAF3769930.1 hypothetical protein M406DRAFT_246934 [Cryphonectria parasitica EP155]